MTWMNLNDKKLRLRQTSPFYRSCSNSRGSVVDPHKVQAIQEMPPPTDVAYIAPEEVTIASGLNSDKTSKQSPKSFAENATTAPEI